MCDALTPHTAFQLNETDRIDGRIFRRFSSEFRGERLLAHHFSFSASAERETKGRESERGEIE